MSQQNDNSYLKKFESEKNIFSQTGKNSIERTPNKKIQINKFKQSLTDKNKCFLKNYKVGMTQKNLFQKDDQDEKNSEMSKKDNLSPSKIENEGTTLLINKAIDNNSNHNLNDNDFTNFFLLKDSFKQYCTGEQYEKLEKNKNNIDINNKKGEAIEDNQKNILENKENFNNSLLKNAPNNNNFNNGNFLFNDDLKKNNKNFCKNQDNNNIVYNNIINNKDNFNHNENWNKKNHYNKCGSWNDLNINNNNKNIFNYALNYNRKNLNRKNQNNPGYWNNLNNNNNQHDYYYNNDLIMINKNNNINNNNNFSRSKVNNDIFFNKDLSSLNSNNNRYFNNDIISNNKKNHGGINLIKKNNPFKYEVNTNSRLSRNKMDKIYDNPNLMNNNIMNNNIVGGNNLINNYNQSNIKKYYNSMDNSSNNLMIPKINIHNNNMQKNFNNNFPPNLGNKIYGNIENDLSKNNQFHNLNYKMQEDNKINIINNINKNKKNNSINSFGAHYNNE